MRIPENRDQSWKFIKTHWDQVQTEFTPEMGEIFVDGTGSFCSVEARDDVKSFFAAHPVPAADAALRHALEHIDGCIELRRLQEPNLKKWLAE
jgi:aminopeptidase N/puromycin-sensitive aminopeptidase